MKHFIGRLLAITAVMSVALTTASCGKIDEIVIEDLSQRYLNSDIFSENLVELDELSAQKMLYINPSDYKEIKVYKGTNAVCDEMVIVKTSSPQSMKNVLSEQLERLKEMYAVYRPQELYKTENALLEVYDGTVVLVVGNSYETALQIYDDYIRQR